MKKHLKKITTILIAVMIMNSALTAMANEYNTWYKITARNLNVRYAPGVQYDSFYTLKYGEEVVGKESIDGWTEINCYGFKGFVFSKYLADKNSQNSINNTNNMKYLGVRKITGYNPYCRHCAPNYGITASGKRAVIGETVAMAEVPFGTRIYIKGLGYYTVHDRGVGYGKVDIACADHAACYAITGNYEVYIVE